MATTAPSRTTSAATAKSNKENRENRENKENSKEREKTAPGLRTRKPPPPRPDAPLTADEATLLAACAAGDVDGVYACVWAKVDLNCRIPHYGTTPLSVAFRNGHRPVVNLLIQFGAKFDPDNYGATPVHWAAHHGHSKLIKDQVQQGHISRVDLQKRDFFGSTPLHFASVNNLTDCVQTLLDCGSDSLVANNDGRLASHITTDDKIRNVLLEAQKYDAELHKRQDEEERLAAKKSREAASGADKKKKGGAKAKVGAPKKPATAAAPKTTGKSEIVGSRKVALPPPPPPKKAANSDSALNASAAKLNKKTRASNAWTAA
ncbi:ankyrin repeat-containing domain protein [Obelidium mucronatum]|nr:ankyrin repeat-containing domain protein [Obelidium mucronatum]